MNLFGQFFSLFASTPLDEYKLLPRRTHGKKAIDKEKYLGKGFEFLLKDYPNASILSASYDRRDPIQVEVKLKDGTLVMQFSDFICDLVECFEDSPNVSGKR